MCVTEKFVVKGSCKRVQDKKKVVNLRDGDFKNIFGSIYQYSAECICKIGYLWNPETKACEFLRASCSMKRIGERVCRHNGQCVPVPLKERRYDFQILKCLCTPAWTGYLCTEPVNPCKYSRKLCGSFPCRRDETSLVKGYQCLCSKGFRRFNDFEPRCVNIDECQLSPCQHGGKCQDLVPDPLNMISLLYNCTCIQGFTGENCEIPPKRPEWSSWSSWSICSKTCGIGRLSRQRTCSVRGRCSGLAIQTSACIFLSQSCDSISDSQQGSQLKASGVGWTAEEERIIDDAFHWNEQLFSHNPYDTLHYLKKLEDIITIILCVLLIPLLLICVFNMVVLHPRQWLMMTLRSHINRQGWTCGGTIGHERRKRKRQHKKFMKNILSKFKGKNKSSDKESLKKKSVKINDNEKDYPFNEKHSFKQIENEADTDLSGNDEESKPIDKKEDKDKMTDVIFHVGKKKIKKGNQRPIQKKYVCINISAR